jgi:cysteine-rich repeat protein
MKVFVSRGLAALIALSALSACGDELNDGGESALGIADESPATEQALTGTTSLPATADTTVKGSSNAHKNFGTITPLRVESSSTNRTLVQFSPIAITNALVGKTLTGARLVLTLTSATTGLPAAGQPVDVHTLTKTWTENGATFSCANDTNTGNTKLDCTTANTWSMTTAPLAYVTPHTSSLTVLNARTGTLSFDVLASVEAMRASPTTNFGWLVKLRTEASGGVVLFAGRETANGPVLQLDFAGPCGDGTTDPANGEQCDDGNTVNTDACSNACVLARCGDGAVNGTDQCDDANIVNTDACTNACTTPRCGDAITNGTDQCDDGNAVDEDACTNACTTPRCGDVIVNGTDQCDDGNAVNNDTCTNACTTPRCGDAITNGTDECDDANAVNTDACTNACTTPRCGDAITNGTDQCEDGKAVNNDDCPNASTTPR